MEEVVHFIREYFIFPHLDTWGAIVLSILVFTFFIAEGKWPLRERKGSRMDRIKVNVAVATTAFLSLRIALIPILVYTAIWAESTEVGLFNWVEGDEWLVFILSFLLMDYGNYLWHVLNHRSRFLWRFHNVHHVDLDLDITTGIRFHFGEIFISAFFRGFVILILGVPYQVVLIYEIIFEAATAFHHSNWKLPYKLENALSWVIVTPRMHGIHHSIVQRETNSNYSVIFSCWDRISKSILLNVPQGKINIGVPSYRNPDEQTFKNLLVMPFHKQRPWELPDGSIPQREEKGSKENLKP